MISSCMAVPKMEISLRSASDNVSFVLLKVRRLELALENEKSPKVSIISGISMVAIWLSAVRKA